MNQIFLWDCLEVMKSIPDGGIDLTVTSPPYDNLRTYNGYSWDFEWIAKELFRVTKQGGVVVWVVGDATIKWSESGTSFKQALYFKEIGFNLHDTMIYQKQNYVPLTHNRYEQSFEYMFILSKWKPKTFNPIKIPCIYAWTKNSPTFRHKANWELGKANTPKPISEFKIMGNIWTYQVGKNKGSKDDIWKHPATFPENLAEDHILSWSNPWDIVLDPFAWSWTALKMAKKNGRNYIWIEISKEYIEIIKNRLKWY